MVSKDWIGVSEIMEMDTCTSQHNTSKISLVSIVRDKLLLRGSVSIANHHWLNTEWRVKREFVVELRKWKTIVFSVFFKVLIRVDWIQKWLSTLSRISEKEQRLLTEISAFYIWIRVALCYLTELQVVYISMPRVSGSFSHTLALFRAQVLPRRSVWFFLFVNKKLTSMSIFCLCPFIEHEFRNSMAVCSLSD